MVTLWHLSEKKSKYDDTRQAIVGLKDLTMTIYGIGCWAQQDSLELVWSSVSKNNGIRQKLTFSAAFKISAVRDTYDEVL